MRVLTGITTSGTPHLGNYVGAIKPAITSSVEDGVESFLFLADLHSLIKCQDPVQVHRSTCEIAATWLAAGLDPDRVVFYRQSDIVEIPQLTWILTCMTAKGLMNRAHAYKAAVQENETAGEDPDRAVSMGLFSYPVLMAADILMFKANQVPVGRDQVQHVEMARDIAQRFNHHYGEHFVLPSAAVDENTAVLQGLDGRKMSKSYGNAIPLFLGEKKLRKQINQIRTNLLEPGQPKDADSSAVFQIYQAFATVEQRAAMRREFENGIAWGEAKRQLFELVNTEIAPARQRYEQLMDDLGSVERTLQEGAEKARAMSKPFLDELCAAVGLRALA